MDERYEEKIKEMLGCTQTQKSETLKSLFNDKEFLESLHLLYLKEGKLAIKKLFNYNRADTYCSHYLGSKWTEWQIERAKVVDWNTLDQVERKLYREYLFQNTFMIEDAFRKGISEACQLFKCKHLCDIENIFKFKNKSIAPYLTLLPMLEDDLLIKVKQLFSSDLEKVHQEYLLLNSNDFIKKYFNSRKGEKLERVIETAGLKSILAEWKKEKADLMYKKRTEKERDIKWTKHSVFELKQLASSGLVKKFVANLGISLSSLSEYMKWNGTPGYEKELFMSYLTLSKEDWEEIKHDLNQGVPIALVSSRYQLSSGGLISKLRKLGIHRNEISNEIQKSITYGQRSKLEIWMQNQFKSKTISSYRPFVIEGHHPEIDVYFPEYKIGFECNGSFWHHSNPYKPSYKDKYYHKQKTQNFLSRGIKVYHYWDWQSPIIFCSVIKSKINENQKRVYARKLFIREGIAKEFFKKNHLDGNVRAKLGYYLVDSNEDIMAAISFRDHAEGIEIARYAVKQGVLVLGGFPKLFKAFKRMSGYKGTVITYCTRDLCPDYKDSVYYRNGFTFVKDSGPILSYYVQKSIKGIKVGHHWRTDFQKHKLSTIFDETVNDTEVNFLSKKGILPIYNSGNWKFKIDV